MPLPSLIEMLPMIKMSQKRLLFLQFQFLLASSRTTVINNNFYLGGTSPLYLIFINQFKWAPYNIIYMALNLNGFQTIIVIQGTHLNSPNLNGPPLIILI